MIRKRNTDVNGRSFNDDIIQKVWDKCVPVPGKDGETHRFDVCKTIIHRYSYGKESQMGWEIDHIKPVSKGGTDSLSNLQALQSNLNAQKGDDFPWKCPQKRI